MNKRQGEDIYAWFRSNRFYKMKGLWYYSTREGVDFGPFQSRAEAEENLERFMQQDADKQEDARN